MSQTIKAFLEESAIKVGAKFEQPRPGDAGYDLYASEPVTLFQGKQALVQTGLILEIPDGLTGVIKDRSSMAMRRIYTHAGIIDSSYRGPIGVLLSNASEKNYHIEPGQRIAQLLFVATNNPVIKSVATREDLTATQRGDGAFGSTGK